MSGGNDVCGGIFRPNCGENCHRQICENAGGTFPTLDFSADPYTCILSARDTTCQSSQDSETCNELADCEWCPVERECRSAGLNICAEETIDDCPVCDESGEDENDWKVLVCIQKQEKEYESEVERQQEICKKQHKSKKSRKKSKKKGEPQEKCLKKSKGIKKGYELLQCGDCPSNIMDVD